MAEFASSLPEPYADGTPQNVVDMTRIPCECDFYDQDPDNDTEDGYCHCGHGYYQHEDSGGPCLMQHDDGPDVDPFA